MSKMQIVVRALCLSMVPMLMGSSSDVLRPDVKTGLWETTINTHMNGMPPIPDSVLAKMTPEQKERLMAGTGGPRTMKTCMTEEKLNKGANFADEERPNCKRTIITNTPKVVELQEECTDAQGTRLAKIHYEVTSRDSVSGTIHIDMTRMGKSMTIEGTMQSKWLGDSCGEVK